MLLVRFGERKIGIPFGKTRIGRARPSFFLTACRRAALVDIRLEYFNSMKDFQDIAPNASQYGCVVDILGVHGHIPETISLCSSLNSLNVHGNNLNGSIPLELHFHSVPYDPINNILYLRMSINLLRLFKLHKGLPKFLTQIKLEDSKSPFRTSILLCSLPGGRIYMQYMEPFMVFKNSDIFL